MPSPRCLQPVPVCSLEPSGYELQWEELRDLCRWARDSTAWDTPCKLHVFIARQIQPCQRRSFIDKKAAVHNCAPRPFGFACSDGASDPVLDKCARRVAEPASPSSPAAATAAAGVASSAS